MKTLSVSTAWNFKEGTKTRDNLEEIQRLGLNTIELGYTLTDQQVREILPLLGELGMQVSSIHNFCPVPSDGSSSRHPSNYYRLSSIDEEERKKAVEWTQKTIDLSRHVGSPVVIIHAGTIEIKNDPIKDIQKLFKEGKSKTTDFANLIKGMLKDRQQAKPHYMQALIKSLEEVCRYAQEKDISIGLETRYYPTEMPNFEEIGFLLNRFADKGMFYWHDVGHAEVTEKFGIRPHLDFLKTYGKHMIGMHIHGMEGLRDHKAPFTGDLDFEKVRPYLHAKLIKVIEARYATFDELKIAVGKLSV